MPTETELLLIENPSYHAWWQMVRAYHSVVGVLSRYFEERGITGAQFGVLRCLADAGDAGLMLSDLSKRLMVTCGNTTGVVDRLEQAGYLRRERRRDDRRVILAKLTPKGRKLYSELMPAYQAMLQRFLGDLTAAETEQLSRACERIQVSVDEWRRSGTLEYAEVSHEA
jgi:DNA-binding MarR family transcriptional regulator